MNNQIVYNTYYNFAERGFSVLRFNFRGVGRSQGAFDHGQGELSDAASALDWAQSISPEARACWIAGVSFGSWIGMQLLMRRPEIEGFISIAPPANRFDFSFLAPCPSSGLFVHGDKDRVAPLKEVLALIEKLKTQKGIIIEHAVIPEANHFFEDCIDELQTVVGAYLDKRLGMPRHAPPSVRKERAKPVAPPRRNRIELGRSVPDHDDGGARSGLPAPGALAVRHGRHRIPARDDVLADSLRRPARLGRRGAGDRRAGRRARPRAPVAADGRRGRGQGVPRRAAGPRDFLEALRRRADAAVRHPGRGDGVRLWRAGLLQRARALDLPGRRSTSRRGSPTGRAGRWPRRRSTTRSAT